MFGYPCMFGNPYVLDAPCMFGYSHMFGCPPYVLLPPCVFGGCLDAWCTYTTQRQYALSDWGDVHMLLYIWMPPYVCTAPYVWMSLIPLDAPIHVGCIQTYRGQPNIWRASKHTEGVQTCGGIQPYREVSKHRRQPNIRGHPNIWGECKHMGVSKHTGGHPNIKQVSKHMEASNIQGMSKHMGASKHMGGSQTWRASKHTGGCPNMWGYTTIEMCPNIMEAPKHTGGIKHVGASKNTGGHPNRWGHSHIQEVHPSIWGIWTPLSLTKHAFFELN